MVATKKQLKERWLTSEGKKIRQKIIKDIKKKIYLKYLKNYPLLKNCSIVEILDSLTSRE